MPVAFDRKVTVAFKELPAGLYQLVLLKREGNRGELYFFPGEQVNLDLLAAQALVEFEEQGSALPLAQVTYREENEVRTPQRILRFTAVPLAQERQTAVLP
jgi:hypothetical protein